MPSQKVFVFYAFLLLVTYSTHAQHFKERVYLKDSITFYEGFIIEQAPAKYIKIYRLAQKDTLTIQLADVYKLTKIYEVDSIKAVNKLKPLKKNIHHKYDKIAFVELLGAAGFYSINYDMRTAKNKRDGWGYRVGYERISTNFRDTIGGTINFTKIKFTAIPLVLNYLIGKKKGFLELGVGATYFKFKGEAQSITTVERYQAETFKQTFGNIVGSFNVGYRHLPYSYGFMYRVAFTPLLIADVFVPFIGIGFGYHF